jgi:hypothetical protein
MHLDVCDPWHLLQNRLFGDLSALLGQMGATYRNSRSRNAAERSKKGIAKTEISVCLPLVEYRLAQHGLSFLTAWS